MDLYEKFNVLAAAGDRHLVEFLPANWYLKDKETVKKWKYNLTTVDFRINQMNERIQESIQMEEGKKEFVLEKSSEEAVELMKALMGFNDIVSNVNIINTGQMSQLPLGRIVETNCVFTKDKITPIKSQELPDEVIRLIRINSNNIDNCYEGIKHRNLFQIYSSFVQQPLCCNLKTYEAKELFEKMCYDTKNYLNEFFDLDEYFKK
jgi:alpha-galactosidase